MTPSNETATGSHATTHYTADTNERLRTLLRSFVEECKSSPLYTALCPLLAETPEAIVLLAKATKMQRRPNLLLAAIHASLLRDPADPLAAWFPTVGGTQSPDDPALADALANFIGERSQELQALIEAGSTQTNEPGRSAVLFAALADVSHRVGSPLAMIDVGTSAGLNLRFDHYSYTYEMAAGDRTMGSATSPVRVVCDMTDSPANLPVEAMHRLQVAHRAGLDLNPLDVHDEFQSRWLQALVWPDEPVRCARLADALELARSVPVDIRQGDAVDAITALIAEVPAGVHPVIVTTWVMTYLPAERRVAFDETLAKLGASRPLTWVFMEHPFYARELPFPPESRTDRSELGCPIVAVDYTSTGSSARWLGTTHGHGTWLRWLA